ncbi:MAG: hypothetical protein AMXMBFR44_2110 [Candidatus Campbellbacteria bacterium]
MAGEQAQVKTAEWVADYYHPYQGMILKCSSCGGQIRHQDGNRNPRFCPNCGAQMSNPNELPKGWLKALDSF